MSTIEFRPVTPPSSIDAADAADYRLTVELRNRIYREISGHDDNALAPAELLPISRPDEHEDKLLWLILENGVGVGRMGVDIPLEAGSKSAYVFIDLVRDAWGRGIGTAAHEVLVRAAVAAGRSILQTWVEHGAAVGETLAPPTGFGTIPRDHAARFMIRHGYSLEQVVRVSAFDLSAPRERLATLASAARDAASGYRIVQWELPTPPAYVEGYAWMKSRMTTDAPNAGLVIDEEVWDAERLRAHDDIYISGDRRMLVTAAQHVETGEMCAFNELVIGRDTTRASHQEDTLVLSTHRGHRLGMLVKAEGILRWPEFAPESPRVITYNAEENRPMLDINEAIGFAPIAYEGAWKLVV